jgi:hypothetical protein
MDIDIDKHKKQTTENILNNINTKLKQIKSKKDHTHSNFFNDLDIITNKDFMNNFRKGNNKYDKKASSIHNIFESNRPLLSTISKDEHIITNKLNNCKRHCSQDNNSNQHTLTNYNNQQQFKVNVINSKKAEIIQSLIPKGNIYSYRNKLTKDSNSHTDSYNNITQSSFLKFYKDNNNTKNSKQNSSYHKDRVVNFSSLLEDKPKTIIRNTIYQNKKVPTFISYKNNIMSSIHYSSRCSKKNKFLNTKNNSFTKGVLNKFNNSNLNCLKKNNEIEQFSNFNNNSNRKEIYSYSQGKHTLIYSSDVKPLLNKVKCLSDDEAKIIDKTVLDDLITLASIIKIKLNY